MSSPAIEYLTRKHIKYTLKTPCSFLVCNSACQPVAITLQKENDINIIRHWFLAQNNSGLPLPPTTTFRIKGDIFQCPEVVGVGYKLLPFKESPYITGNTQRSDMPMAAIDELEYQSAMESFYNPPSHKKTRENFLWKSFERVHIPQRLKINCNLAHNSAFDIHRSVVQYQNKKVWKIWELWKKEILLGDDNQTATELILTSHYKKPEKEYKYLHGENCLLSMV